MKKRILYFLFFLFFVFTIQCGLFQPKPEKGSLLIQYNPEQTDGKLHKASESLSSVRCILVKGSEIKYDRYNNTKQNSNFYINITELEPADNYSVLLYGYNSNDDMIGRFAKSSITIRAGEETPVSMAWIKFKPTLISPVNETTITDNTPSFDWSDVSGAVNYELMVSDNIGFSNPVIWLTGLTASGYTATKILADSTYYWRVRSKDSQGNWGDWAEIWEFTIKTEQPVLRITPISLDFGSSETTNTFTITNSGTGTLTWNVSADKAWISEINPMNGSTTTETDTVKMTIDRSKLNDGENIGKITITSNVGADTIDVKADGPLPDDPILSVSPNFLDFGYSETAKIFNIANIGTGILTWSVTDKPTWVSEINPTSDSTTTVPDQVTVTIDRSKLNDGENTGKITITSNVGADTVDVKADGPPPDAPILSISPNFLDFGVSETVKTFNITNIGTGALTWNVNVDKAWISEINPMNGSTTTETDTVKVTIDRIKLNEGENTGKITITSNAGADTVNVRAYIKPKEPVLSVSPDNLDFGVSETVKTFNIANIGTGILTWSVTEKPAWVSEINPMSDSTTTVPDQVTVTIDRSKLNEGENKGKITITSNAGADTVDVKADGPPPDDPILSVSPNFLDFGVNETVKTFYITNIGTGTLTWNVSVDSAWISVIPPSGSTTTETDTVTVTIDRSKLSPGLNTGTITVTSNGGTETISVSAFKENIEIFITPPSINFGDVTNNTPGKTEIITISCATTSTSNLIGSVNIIGNCFSIESGGGNFNLQPSNTKQIIIRFAPNASSEQLFNGTLTVTHNGTNITSPTDVAIQGRGVGTGRIRVINPTYETVWTMGEGKVTIEWETGSLGGNVEIQLVNGNYEYVGTITAATSNDGNYNDWIVPSNLVPRNDYKIYIIHEYDIEYSKKFTIVKLIGDYANKDAYVNEDVPDQEYGDYTTLVVSENDSSPYKDRWILFDFDFIRNIPANSKCHSATLKLAVYPSGSEKGTPFDVNLLLLINNWNESSVSWNNRPSTLSFSASVTIPSGDNNGYNFLDFTYPTQQAISYINHLTMPYKGFLIFSSGSGKDMEKWYYSRENISNKRPYLEIQYYFDY